MVPSTTKYLTLVLASTFAFTDALDVNKTNDVNHKFSAVSVYANKACSGPPSGIVYSTTQPPVQDDKCQSVPGSEDISIKNHQGANDLFLDAMQRFGCNESFVLVGMGDHCSVGTDRIGSKVTTWAAFQADNVCHQLSGHGAFSLDDDDDHDDDHHDDDHDKDHDDDHDDDHDKPKNKATNNNKSKPKSIKVCLTDNQLRITQYKDAHCQQEDESNTIDAKTKTTGKSYFCEDGDLYQIYDASGKSSLFKSSISPSDCKSGGAVGSEIPEAAASGKLPEAAAGGTAPEAVGVKKSSALRVGISLLVIIVGLVGETLLHA